MAVIGEMCQRCYSLPCRCFRPDVQLQPYVDPTILIRIAAALERIADALEERP